MFGGIRFGRRRRRLSGEFSSFSFFLEDMEVSVVGGNI